MFFKDVAGQDNLKKLLRENIDKGRVPHAQLFEGKSGYGALTLAIAYATYLNCENRTDGDACGKCRSCYSMRNLEHVNLHFVYPSNKTKKAESLYSDGGTAKVTSDSYIKLWRDLVVRKKGYITEYEWYEEIGMGDTSRNASGIIGRADAKNLMDKLKYKSIGEGYKVVIIWLPERMNTEAANTLLKEFEEPGESTVFLFVTENSGGIISTVKSRTQQITVPPVKEAELEKYLAEKGMDASSARTIANQSGGDINILNSLLEENDGSGSEDTTLEIFRELMGYCYSNNYSGLFQWVAEFSGLNREEIRMFFTESMRLLRVCYLRTMDVVTEKPHDTKENDFINKFHPFIKSSNIENIIGEFESAFQEIRRNGNVKIIMSYFTLNMCKLINR